MIFTNPLKDSILKPYPKGSIYQGYGENPALYAHLGLDGHNGLDIALTQPCEVLAATDGIVTLVQTDTGGYGNQVRIFTDKQADGYYYETIYGHMEKQSVVYGQRVKAGDLIGWEGNTGFVISGSTSYWGNAPAGKGVHLHFGLRRYKDRNGEGLDVDITLNGKILKLCIPEYYNGRKGSIDPLPYLLGDITITPMLEKGKGGLVRNMTDGSYGLNLGDVILDASKERGALLALDILMRKGFGVQLTDDEWNSVPHRAF